MWLSTESLHALVLPEFELCTENESSLNDLTQDSVLSKIMFKRSPWILTSFDFSGAR